MSLINPLQPILAPNKIPTEKQVSLPMAVSRKFDGVRCILAPGMTDLPEDNTGTLLSRSFKPLPNKWLRPYFARMRNLALHYDYVFDGELWSPTLTFQEIISYVMSHDKPIPEDCNLKYCIFDGMPVEHWNAGNEQIYAHRYLETSHLLHKQEDSHRELVEQVLPKSWEHVQELLAAELAVGGEGLILRSLRGRYKHGRCTMKEQNMLKLKAFDTIDGIVVDTIALNVLAETSPLLKDEFGYSKRTAKREDHVPVEELGALIVLIPSTGQLVNVGSGFNWRGGEKDRVLLWRDRQMLLGRWCEIRYMKVGAKDTLRMPTFVRWRADLDGKPVIKVSY